MKIATKRAVSVLIALIMVISMIPTVAFAAGQEMGISASTVSGCPGDTVTVTIKLSNNPGIASLKFKVSYNEEYLTLNSVSFGQGFGAYVTAPEPYQSPQTISFVSPLEPVTTNGLFASLNFKIAQNAPNGSSSDITISYDEDDVFDSNYDNVKLNIVNGKVNIYTGVPGDVSGDKNVNNKDAILLFRYVAGWNVEVDEAALDVTGDGKINNKDAITLFRYVADWPDIELHYGPICKHNLHPTAAVAATCTEPGNIDYWYCGICGRYFTSANATTQIELADTVIPAKGHTPVVDSAVPATATSTGLTEGSHCSTCGTVLVPQEPTPILVGNTHEITYDIANGDPYLQNLVLIGEINNPNPDRFDESETLALVNLSVPGYRFLGWYDGAGDGQGHDANKVTAIPAGTTINQQLYAHWNKVTYTITFDNSSMSLPSSTKTYTVDQKFPLDKPSIDRYVFLGWTTDSDTLMSEIKAGTTGNFTLHSNWTSKRNLAKPVSSLGDPIIIEDTVTGRLLFTYEIGQIENVPLYTIKNLPSAGGVVSVYTETVHLSISETDATAIAKSIDHITTDSTSWTLSEDWNATTHIEDSVLTEHGYNRTTGQQVGKTSSNTYTLTTEEYDNTVVKTNDGTVATTTQYDTEEVNARATWESKASLTVSDTESVKYTDSAEVSAEVGASYGGVGAKMGASMGTSTEISSETSATASGETTISNELNAKVKTGTDTVTVKDNTKTTTTDKGWNKSSSSSSTNTSSFTEYEEQTLSERIAKEYTYGESYAKGGSNSNSADWSSSTGESNQYSSTFTYFTSKETTEGVSYSINGESDGSYRLVRAGVVHVFAVVIYDIATAQYSVATYNVLDDETYTYIDYSATSAAKFDDNENGVLPFEIPYYVNDYVNGRIVATEGLDYDVTTLSTGKYEGSETSVVVPEYISVDNQDDTYSAYTIRKLGAETFSGKTQIKSVLLSSYIREIPASAFAGCTSLQFVYGTKITSIGDNAFDGCTALGEFKIPSTVESIGVDAFKDVNSIVVTASSKDIVTDAINSGAKRITINISAIAEEMSNQTLIIPNTVEYFELQGGRNTFNGLKIQSEAGTTVLNGITIKESTSIPLVISSEHVTLNQVNVESPSYVLLLKGNAPTVSLYGKSMLVSSSTNAVVCRNVTLEVIASNVTTKLEVTGDFLYYGAKPNESLVSFPERGEFVSLTSSEFDKYIQGSYNVILNANGGTVNPTSIVAYIGSEIGALPTPTRDYYSFTGWFTAASGGTQVTEDWTWYGANDLTLYAHWELNPASDWVSASELPEGAQVVDRKWTYTLTSYTTSSSSSLSGWTRYDSSYTWSSWGAWSSWQDNYVGSNDSTQVETRTGYHYYYYLCPHCGAHMYQYSTCFKWAGGCGGNIPSTGTYHAFRSSVPYSSTYDFESTGVYCSNNTEEGRAFAYINSSSQYYVAPITQYRYRTRSQIWTYYYMKTEELESTVYPTGDNISNIKEWVKYRAK